jgi:molybdate transport system permease protein
VLPVREDFEKAAAVDGATPIQVFRYISFPLAWRSFLGGAVLTWGRALGEFGATIIFAGNYPGRTQTMPLAVYIGFEIDFNEALTLAVILLVLSFGILIAVRTILRGASPDRS